MKKWTPAAIGIGLLLTFGVAMAEGLLTFPTPQRSVPWGSAILSGIGWSVLVLYLRISRRRRIGRELPAGEYMLAVKGAPGVRYTVGFDDETEVIWRSVEATEGDPWYTSAHRSSGEPAGLDVIVYDEDGMPVREWFYLASWIRNDCALDAIMALAGRNSSALNFRVFLYIGEFAVRLVVFPGAEPPPRNDDWASDPEFHKSGTTVWLGKRDEFGRWGEKRQGSGGEKAHDLCLLYWIGADARNRSDWRNTPQTFRQRLVMLMRLRLGSLALAAALGATAVPSAFAYTDGLDCDDDLFPPKIYHLDLVNRNYDPDDPDAQLRPSHDRCIDDARANGPAIYQCYGEEMDFQNKRLHAAYSKLVNVLGEQDKQALRKEQRQWLRELDLLCGWGFNEGSRGRMVSDTCDVIHRGLRATELERRVTRLGTPDKVEGLMR